MGNQLSKISALMVGLNSSGKTTILSTMKGVRVPGGPPTSGYHIEAVAYNNYDFTIWVATSGYDSHSYRGADAIICVVDSTDIDRLNDAKEELHEMLKLDSTIPLLVFANKKDLPGAATSDVLAERLELSSNKGRHWHIQPTCATHGEGIYEGLDWLIQEHNIRNSKTGEGESESKQIEKQHLKALDKAMKENGTLDQNLVHGVLIGVPRSGKSSLMSRLLGEGIKLTSPSTGVIDKAIQVEVKKSTSTAASVVGGFDSKWVRISYKEEALGYGALLLSTRRGRAESSPSGKRSEHRRVQKAPSFSPKTHKPLQKGVSVHTFSSPKSRRTLLKKIGKSKSAELPKGFKHTRDIFKEALKSSNKKLEDIQKELEDSWSLYLTDTGGQIEFQELLPLLVSSPSIFFLVFRLDRDLNERFTIEYLHPTDGPSKPYRSTLTIREALLQSLVSIASMRSFVFKGNLKEGDVAVRPKVFFVATHKDKLDPATAEDKIKAIDSQLKQMVMSTSLYDEDVVQFASRDQLAYTVNNLSEVDTDFQKIRSAVDHVVMKGEFKITLPSSWLLYNLALRQLKSRIISYEEARSVASANKIASEEELDEVLYFLHSKLGLVRHFPEETLHDVVVLDPQLLFDKVTQLIINTFTFENVGVRITTEFEKKGIFPIDAFKQVSEDEDTLLSPERLTKLLEQLRIIAPYQTKVEPHQYFIPCALAHTDDVPTTLEQASSDIPPLVITFSCGYIPKGVSGSLIVYLLQNEMKSSFEIKLEADTIYKNQLSFSVGPHFDLVTLRMDATHFTVSFTLCTHDGRVCTSEEVSVEIRRLVEEGIKSVLQDLPYARDIKHSLTFYCPNCVELKDCHPAEMRMFDGSPIGLRCTKTRKLFNLPSGCEKWFPKCIKVNRDSVCSSTTTSLRNESTSSSFINSGTHPVTENGQESRNRNSQSSRHSSNRLHSSAGDSPDLGEMPQRSDSAVFTEVPHAPYTAIPQDTRHQRDGQRMTSTESESSSRHNIEENEVKECSEMKRAGLIREPSTDTSDAGFTSSGDVPKSKEHDSSIISSVPQLTQTFKMLLPVASQWQDIAVLLGVSHDRVEVIRQENLRVNSCLRAVLSDWLIHQSSPPPSWGSLAEAMELLDNHVKAKEIREKYSVFRVKSETQGGV